jgi:hypothetical protein
MFGSAINHYLLISLLVILLFIYLLYVCALVDGNIIILTWRMHFIRSPGTMIPVVNIPATTPALNVWNRLEKYR